MTAAWSAVLAASMVPLAALPACAPLSTGLPSALVFLHQVVGEGRGVALLPLLLVGPLLSAVESPDWTSEVVNGLPGGVGTEDAGVDQDVGQLLLGGGGHLGDGRDRFSEYVPADLGPECGLGRPLAARWGGVLARPKASWSPGWMMGMRCSSRVVVETAPSFQMSPLAPEPGKPPVRSSPPVDAAPVPLALALGLPGLTRLPVPASSSPMAISPQSEEHALDDRLGIWVPVGRLGHQLPPLCLQLGAGQVTIGFLRLELVVDVDQEPDVSGQFRPRGRGVSEHGLHLPDRRHLEVG